MPRGKKPPPTKYAPSWLDPTGGSRYPTYLPTITRPTGGSRYPTYLPTITRQAFSPTGGGRAPAASPAGARYPLYLPLAPMRPSPTGADRAPTTTYTPPQLPGTDPSLAQYFGRYGYFMKDVLDPEQYERVTGRQYTEPPGPPEPPEAPGGDRPERPTQAGGGGGGGGGKGKGKTVAPPPGVDVDEFWYREFQRQHEGQTPEEFYAKTGEGLGHALADEEWARGFAEMYGRPPSQYDWDAHWYASRRGYNPSDYDKWKVQQSGGGGGGGGEDLDDWEKQLRDWEKQDREWLEQQRAFEQEQWEWQREQWEWEQVMHEAGMRSPVYQPLPIVWR